MTKISPVVKVELIGFGLFIIGIAIFKSGSYIVDPNNKSGYTSNDSEILNSDTIVGGSKKGKTKKIKVKLKKISIKKR